LKKYDCKDGFFVQWVECAIVFLFGLGINFARGMPKFNAIAAIGGVLYATGNIGSVPIVQAIGVGVGMLVWGSVQVTVGWAVARFGLFGTKKQTVHTEWMNYAGLILTIITGLILVFVKHEDPHQMHISDAELELKNSDPTTNNVVKREYIRSDSDEGGTFRMDKRKLFFLGLAVFLGILHGLMLTPIVYVQDSDTDHSENVLDYIFSHFSAVFAFSTIYFVLYSAYKRSRPFIASELVLPSVAYGILWSIGMVLFIVANNELSQTVSFPILTRAPAIIGALQDVFLWKTVKGRRNLILLSIGVCVGVAGVLLVALSNQKL